MKVRSVPAQITTVEDKIAGNLNLTQMILLMIPIFWLMIVYTLFSPFMHFAWYKVPLFLIVCVSALILALRVKEKILLHWIVILLRYNLRPKYHLFDKNDAYLRTMDLVVFDKNKKKKMLVSLSKGKERAPATIPFSNIARLEDLLGNPKYSFSIKSHKKGGLHVAFEQKQQ